MYLFILCLSYIIFVDIIFILLYFIIKIVLLRSTCRLSSLYDIIRRIFKLRYFPSCNRSGTGSLFWNGGRCPARPDCRNPGGVPKLNFIIYQHNSSDRLFALPELSFSTNGTILMRSPPHQILSYGSIFSGLKFR